LKFDTNQAKKLTQGQKGQMGFISFGALYFCLGGLKPPMPPMPGYIPVARALKKKSLT